MSPTSFTYPMPPLQMWAGMECTTNRVGEQYFHQLDRTGHTDRISDLTDFAQLGITSLRYPVLWERIAPEGLAQADWAWPDERLARLHELNVRPIVGLVHHGSGPRHTNLLDEGFATGLAEFAGAVAQRYPWLDSFTPVNEPLTTARFSGLYGHWYPHKHDTLSWARALLNQCRAVILSMQAIRREIPHARLVQTEDLGKTFSTPTLQYQADFENERRWLSFDLIGGYLTPHHPMWEYLLSLGIQEAELAWFQEHGHSPEVFGINYYLTSERFLDEQLDGYPFTTHGGNQRHRYADIEAVRVRDEGLIGPAQILQELWQRYHRPVALTEVHNGCTREEQMRWLFELWQAAEQLRYEGVPVEAVTVWSLLGAYDWDSLVTRQTGHYESGVFDLRAACPRPTALATLMEKLATDPTQSLPHPVLAEPGWWHRLDRFCYGFKIDSAGQRQFVPATEPPPSLTLADVSAHKGSTLPQVDPGQPAPSYYASTIHPLVLIGTANALSQALTQACYMRGLTCQLLTPQTFDFTDDPIAMEKKLKEWQPWAVIDTSDFDLNYDKSWARPQLELDNLTRNNPLYLAQVCARLGLKLLTFSSSHVFDGRKTNPYVESDSTVLPGHAGYNLAETERQILQTLDQALIIRSGPSFSSPGKPNFISETVKSLTTRHPVVVPVNELVSPTYLPELVSVSLDLLLDGECGYWHLANKGAVSWAEWVGQIAERAGLTLPTGNDLIQPVASSHSGLENRRICKALDSERGQLMSSLDQGLERYFQDLG